MCVVIKTVKQLRGNGRLVMIKLCFVVITVNSAIYVRNDGINVPFLEYVGEDSPIAV